MKVALIINPLSGSHKAPLVKELAQHHAAAAKIELDVRTIGGAGEGTTLAREAVQQGAERVIAVGGDGTLNAIAAGLLGSCVPMGIVPMGSGNGYSRSLGLPRKPDPALAHAFTATARPMDVGYLNDRLFIGTAGIGFDARVAWKFDRSEARGMANYMRIILKDILSSRPMRTVLKANHEVLETDVLMLVFCNSREFGNGAVISPTSVMDDGLAELQVVRKPSLLPLMRAFYDMYTGRADRSPCIRTVRTREAQVNQDGTLAHLDGEPCIIGRDITFRLEPKRLWVVG